MKFSAWVAVQKYLCKTCILSFSKCIITLQSSQQDRKVELANDIIAFSHVIFFYPMKNSIAETLTRNMILLKVVKMSEIYALEETYYTVIIYHKRTKITQRKVYRNYQIRVSKRKCLWPFLLWTYESYRQKKINLPILLFGFCSVQEICLSMWELSNSKSAIKKKTT